MKASHYTERYEALRASLVRCECPEQTAYTKLMMGHWAMEAYYAGAGDEWYSKAQYLKEQGSRV